MISLMPIAAPQIRKVHLPSESMRTSRKWERKPKSSSQASRLIERNGTSNRQTRTDATSALAPKADITQSEDHVRFVS
jgi:hypothetical protein